MPNCRVTQGRINKIMSPEIKKKYSALGRLALVVTTLIWGTSFVVLKNTLYTVPTFYILAFRFLGAALLMLLIGHKALKTLDKKLVINGAVLGALLFAGYTVQTYGLCHTTASKNAFLTASYCVLVPFVSWIVHKKRPDSFSVIATFVCLIGVGFVSLKNDLSVGLGDLLTLCSGVFYAVHIVLTAKYIKGRSVIMLTMVQFTSAGLLSAVAALLTSPFPTTISPANIWSIVYLCVMCTAICFVLQTFGQKHTPAATAAIIMTLESVFGAAFSVFINHDPVTTRLLTGFVLIFSAVLISETKLSFLHPKHKTPPELEAAPIEPKLFE